MPLPTINPPLINSANPWCSNREDLQRLFDNEFTGAVTTRTSLLDGFPHDPTIHQFTFFDPRSGALSDESKDSRDGPISEAFAGSLNTLGYSPHPLASYLSMLGDIVATSTLPDTIRQSKPFIISVTGSAEDVVACYLRIQAIQDTLLNPLCMEINLSCPNIPSKPPPAYSKSSLIEYLEKLAAIPLTSKQRVAIGIKTPPYTYHGQFQVLVDALNAMSDSRCPVDFITATNTLGSSLLLDLDETPALKSASGAGIGGMAGAPLHPLTLGNVKTIRQLLDMHEKLSSIHIIGVGGVDDANAYRRMRAVGASIVGVGTALGREGIPVFQKILAG